MGWVPDSTIYYQVTLPFQASILTLGNEDYDNYHIPLLSGLNDVKNMQNVRRSCHGISTNYIRATVFLLTLLLFSHLF